MIEASHDIDLRGALICDDVRREDNGKLLLIGVYDNSIVVQALPASLRLSLVVISSSEADVGADFTLRVRLDDDEIRTAGGHIAASGGGQGVLIFRGIALKELQKAGNLAFDMRLDDGGWQNIVTLPLNVRA